MKQLLKRCVGSISHWTRRVSTLAFRALAAGDRGVPAAHSISLRQYLQGTLPILAQRWHRIPEPGCHLRAPTAKNGLLLLELQELRLHIVRVAILPILKHVQYIENHLGCLTLLRPGDKIAL